MRKRILWIEDEMYKIGDLVDGLRAEDIEVINAVTEEEWREEPKREAGYFDVVILDIRLPRGGRVVDEKPEDWMRRGEKLLVDIKQRWPNTPVVVFTALPADEHEDRIRELGADDYIEKPVQVRKFEEVIFKWLGIEEKETD